MLSAKTFRVLEGGAAATAGSCDRRDGADPHRTQRQHAGAAHGWAHKAPTGLGELHRGVTNAPKVFGINRSRGRPANRAPSPWRGVVGDRRIDGYGAPPGSRSVAPPAESAGVPACAGQLASCSLRRQEPTATPFRRSIDGNIDQRTAAMQGDGPSTAVRSAAALPSDSVPAHAVAS